MLFKFLNCEKYLFVKKQNKTKQNKTKTKTKKTKKNTVLWLRVAKVCSWGLALKGLTFSHQYYIRYTYCTLQTSIFPGKLGSVIVSVG